jgi:hypothetical protein
MFLTLVPIFIDDGNGIAVLQHIAGCIAVDLATLVNRRRIGMSAPLMGAFGANEQVAILVGKFGIAFWAWW